MNTEKEVLKLILLHGAESIAPRESTYNGKWKSWLFGIGKDHTAEILMPLESYEELLSMVLEE